MRKLFRALLSLYPLRHRDLFGTEMEAVFALGVQEHRLLGWSSYVGFILVELGGLVLGAITARLEKDAPVPATTSTQQNLPEEVLEAQNRVRVNLDRLLFAISHHEFREARIYSDEERKAREDLRRVREKYGLGESA